MESRATFLMMQGTQVQLHLSEPWLPVKLQDTSFTGGQHKSADCKKDDPKIIWSAAETRRDWRGPFIGPATFPKSI